MPRIFISYRRTDSMAVTGRIHDRLAAEFGDKNTFKDVDDIPLGADFRSVLEREVESCHILLAIISQQWVNVTDSLGQRRLDDPNDFVRVEIESGLKRGDILVIPVLVNGAQMPDPSQLPDDLRDLAYRNAALVRDDPDFNRDMIRLIAQINRSLQPKRRGFLLRWVAGGVIVTVALVIVLLGLLNKVWTDEAQTQTVSVFPAVSRSSVPTHTEARDLTPVSTEVVIQTQTKTNLLESQPLKTTAPALTLTSADHAVQVTIVAELRGHSINAAHVVFSPDGTLLASASEDQTVQLWDVTDPVVSTVLQGHTGNVAYVDFSPDGALLASAAWDGTVRLWDVATGTEQAVLKEHVGAVYIAVFSPDESLLASAGEDGKVRLWDVATGSLRTVLEGHIGPVIDIAFSPDGTLLASASFDDTGRLWDVASGRTRAVFSGHSGDVTDVVFSPDGRLVASTGTKTVRVWDVATGIEQAVLGDETASPTHAAFSPDGLMLASGGWDAKVRLWDVASAAQCAILEGHTEAIEDLVFSPDGTILASASRDDTVRLWEVASRTEQAQLTGHKSNMTDITFSPDGGWLASASYDGVVRLWKVIAGTTSTGVQVDRGPLRGDC